MASPATISTRLIPVAIQDLVLLDSAFTFLLISQVVLLTILFFLIKHNQRIRRRTVKQQALYESIITFSDDAIITKDSNGIITSWNQGAEKTFQYAGNEVIGRHISVLIPPERLQEEVEIMGKIKQNKLISHYETERLKKDGSLIPISLTVSPLKDAAGNIIGASKIARDISERKRAETDRAKHEIRFRETLDKMLEGVEIIDFDCRYLYVNDSYEKQVKCSKNELLGFTIMEKFPGIEQTEIFNTIQRCIKKQISIHMEDSFTFSDRSTRWFEMSFQPVPEGVFILSMDITDRKRGQEYLIQSEKRLRGLIEHNNDIIWLMDENLKPIYRSPNLERITGWRNEEIEKEDNFLVHPSDRQKMTFLLNEVKLNPGKIINFECRLKHKAGYYLEINGTAVNMLHDASIKGIVTNFRDVTESKQASEKIKLSEERFRSLIENSYDIVSITDERFRPIYRSPSSLRITGHTNEERDEVGGIEQIHPDDGEELKSIMKEVLTSPDTPFPVSFRIKHKKGHYVFLEGIMTNMLNNESIKGIVSNFRDVTETRKAEEKIKQSENIYRTIASSIPGSVICLLDKDYRYLLIEGDMLEAIGYSKKELLGNKVEDVVPTDRLNEVLPHFKRVFQGESFTVESVRANYDVLTRYVPLRDENNHVFATMVVLFDVSELKQAQRAIAELNVGLEHKIKERTLELEVVNKELEAFSYSVAHDLRTPLRAISGYSTMLDEDYSDRMDTEGRRLISRLVYNAKRMGTLIDDLLTFSRLGRKEIQKSVVDMQQITEACINDLNLKEDYPGSIIIHDLHAVMADPSLLKHVMINLLSNAVKYSSKKEKPVIEISSQQKTTEIVYSIRDNGVGFDMVYVNKLFGVFQRLHSSDQFDGTGVGLAIVQRIIHRHQGTVWADGKVSEGATFHFSLPVFTNL